MAVEDKTFLISQIEEILSPFMTKDSLSTSVSKISELLNSYDITYQTIGQSYLSTDFLDAFLNAKIVEGKAEKTITRYRYVITRFMDAVKIGTSSITIHHIRKYFSDEKNRGISDNSLEGTRQVLSSYFGWLLRENLIKMNPMNNFTKIKVMKKKRLAYSKSEIEKLKRSATNYRDLAVISFLLSTGCRVSEMTALNRSDIDLVNSSCVVDGKGKKERTVYFDEITSMYLKTYLENRKDDHIALFTGKTSDRLTSGGVRAMLKRLSDETNIPGVHPHRFRRTCCTNLINLGMPIQDVAIILGHDKIDTTLKYTVIDQDRVKNEYQKLTT